MLEEALAAGIAAAGGDAMLGGVLPTPAAAVLVRSSASISRRSSPPLTTRSATTESSSSRRPAPSSTTSESPRSRGWSTASGSDRRRAGARPERRPRRLHPGAAEVFQLDLSGMRVALDCANGATYRAAPVIFGALGADVLPMAAEPDGRNINDGCGSTHPEGLIELVRGGRGDRLRLRRRRRPGPRRRRRGAAPRRRRSDRADRPGPAAPRRARRRGGGHGDDELRVHDDDGEGGDRGRQTQVGDRYVIEQLLERDWALGGEQSGHLVWTGFTPTGDGIAGPCSHCGSAGADLDDVEPFERLPQRLENVAVADRAAIEGATERLGGGRAGERASWRDAAASSSARPGPSPSSGSWSRRRRPTRPSAVVRAACRHRPRRARPERTPTTLSAHVRHRRICRRPTVPGPADGRAGEARIPGLRLGRHLSDLGRPDRQRARCRQPRQPPVGSRGARRTATRRRSPSRRSPRRSGSGTRAGRPTAGSPRRTPIHTATAAMRSTSSSTASSRTTRSCAASSGRRATPSPPRPTPRSSPT